MKYWRGYHHDVLHSTGAYHGEPEGILHLAAHLASIINHVDPLGYFLLVNRSSVIWWWLTIANSRQSYQSNRSLTISATLGVAMKVVQVGYQPISWGDNCKPDDPYNSRPREQFPSHPEHWVSCSGVNPSAKYAPVKNPAMPVKLNSFLQFVDLGLLKILNLPLDDSIWVEQSGTQITIEQASPNPCGYSSKVVCNCLWIHNQEPVSIIIHHR